MIRKARRRWCKMFHRAIFFAGGPTYECRTCGEVFDNPALKPVPRTPARAEEVPDMALRAMNRS